MAENPHTGFFQGFSTDWAPLPPSVPFTPTGPSGTQIPFDLSYTADQVGGSASGTRTFVKFVVTPDPGVGGPVAQAIVQTAAVSFDDMSNALPVGMADCVTLNVDTDYTIRAYYKIVGGGSGCWSGTQNVIVTEA